MKKFLILGFGRMGITHLAHINGYYSSRCYFDIYDPSRIFKMASWFNFRKNINFIRKIPTEINQYDGVIITSPPKFHSINLQQALNLSNNFFIEKPLQLSDSDIDAAREKGASIYTGYVLRSNPCVEYLKEIYPRIKQPEIKVSVLSNLGNDVVDDWRFDLSKGGGCLNELGSHAINLALLFSGDVDKDRPVEKIENLSVGTFDIKLNSDVSTEVKGDWNTTVRKTMYKIELCGVNTQLICDLQGIEGTLNGSPLSWSPRQQKLEVGFYIRGIDFALQCSNWISSSFKPQDLQGALLTDTILEETISHG